MVTRNQVIHALFNELQHHLETVEANDLARTIDGLHHDYTDQMREVRMKHPNAPNIIRADQETTNHDYEALVNG